MINLLKQINEKLINIYYGDLKNLRKQKLIQKILSDSECFLKIDVNVAYQILRDLKIKEEEIPRVYLMLI